jgi:hypothetical protein
MMKESAPGGKGRVQGGMTSDGAEDLTGETICTTVSCMAKSEVYSWRLTPDLKSSLEALARAQGKNLAELLEEMAQERIARGPETGESEQARQARLHASAMRFAGAISGGDPDRAAKARDLVRKRIAERHGR